LGKNVPKDQNFYYILNNVLRQREYSTHLKWSGYLYFLQSALSKLPNEELVVYRGIPDIDIIKTQYPQGQSIHWSAYTSTSVQMNTARNFAKSDGVVMKINVVNGKKLNPYSVYDMEAEILLSHNMKYIVSRALYEENDMWFIDLVQQREAETFVF